LRRKPFEGECRCEDCDLQMEWNSIEWTLLDGSLHCSPCTIQDIKQDRSEHGRSVIKFRAPKRLQRLKEKRVGSLSRIRGLRAVQ
jgi:hypothetical protein